VEYRRSASAAAARPRPRRSPSAAPRGYLTAGSYPDDGLGELFLKFGKQGSTLAGVMDAFSIAISIALQYGVPLETYVEKFTNMRFEPAGLTDDPDVRMAQSIMDYVFRRLALDHLDFDTRSSMGIYSASERARHLETGSYVHQEQSQEDVEDEMQSFAQSASTVSKPSPSPGPSSAQVPAKEVAAAAGGAAADPSATHVVADHGAKQAPTGCTPRRSSWSGSRARPPTRRSASPAARRCAPPAPASSARAAAAPAAAADPRSAIAARRAPAPRPP
jgi:hypothetical protein